MVHITLHCIVAPLVVLILAWPASGAELIPSDTRRPLAQIEVKTLDGHLLHSRDLKGKVAVINFWATWCAPCKAELTILDEFRKRYKSEGLIVLAISVDVLETIPLVHSVAKRERWKFTVATDPDGAIHSSLNPGGIIPYTIFVDRNGRISFVNVGYKNGDGVQYRQVLKKLLLETAGR
jgi:cytochrome c biogenesis protein CcmG/thiol:disulfide interchange protein DsbE